ncbi:MAG: PKD domain-containing protein, partial [Bacteroidetes bacterium]|nr:PKD domain-containing protein [Bacteroidota bacterium]
MMQSFRFFPFTVAFFFISTFCRAQLNANFTSSVISGCVPLTVNFTNTSTGNPASYNWNFGNGNSSILENPSATYSLPGTYTVKLMVSNSSASDQEIKTNYITVYSNPVAAFTVNPDTACAGSPVTFTSNSLAGTAGAINHWRWSFDDGYVDSITGGVAIHTYSFAQVFHANLIISDVHGCNSTISKNVVTVNGPIANFVTTPASGCNAPINISFTNTTSGFVSGYQWNFGDPSSGSGNVSTLTNPNHLYNNTGTYNITLIANSALCTASFSYSLQIIHTAAAFSTDTMICLGDTALFSNITIPSNASYSWDFGDGSTSTSSNPFHVFQNSNFFTVQLTATANGCIHTTSHIVHVRTRPNATILATPSFSCLLPQIVSFSVPTPNIAHWLWNFDDPSSGANNTSALASPSHTYTLFGIDTPYVIVTDVYGCKDTAVLHHLNLKEFTVGIQSFFVTPTAQIPLDSGCVPLTLLFEGTININSFPPVQYVWNFGDSTGNFTSSSSTITHTFTSAGHFHVTLTVTNQAGCIATDSHWITTGTLPNAGFAWSDTVTCFGGTVTMYNTTPQPVTSWSWNFGDGQ